jgi:Secretion system C-terminal sorting domain
MKKLFLILVSTIAFSAVTIAQTYLTSGTGWTIYNDVGSLVGLSKVVTTTAPTCSAGTPMWHGPKSAITGLIGTNFANTTLRFRKTFTVSGCEDFTYCLKTNLADVKVYIDNQLVNPALPFKLYTGTKTIEVKSTMPNLNWPNTVQPFISFVGTSAICNSIDPIDPKIVKNNTNVEFAPNPADLQITATNPNAENAIISVYSMTGQMMYSNTIGSKNTLEINTSDFSNGLYIVKLRSASGEEMTKKVIVSH